MALFFELLLTGGLPIAFAIWQIRDVRREQRLRAEQRRIEQAREVQEDEPPASRGGAPAERD